MEEFVSRNKPNDGFLFDPSDEEDKDDFEDDGDEE